VGGIRRSEPAAALVRLKPELRLKKQDDGKSITTV